jgi:hypothetical protein
MTKNDGISRHVICFGRQCKDGLIRNKKVLHALTIFILADSPRFERGSSGPKPDRISWLPHESSCMTHYCDVHI